MCKCISLWQYYIIINCYLFQVNSVFFIDDFHAIAQLVPFFNVWQISYLNIYDILRIEAYNEFEYSSLRVIWETISYCNN